MLEINCPYFARNLTIKEACDNIRDFFLFKNDDLITLKNKHAYCAQVLGQLLITGCSFCYFVFYTQTICLYREYSLICHSWPQCLKNCGFFFQNLCKAIFPNQNVLNYAKYWNKIYTYMVHVFVQHCCYCCSLCLNVQPRTHQLISYTNFIFSIQCTI